MVEHSEGGAALPAGRSRERRKEEWPGCWRKEDRPGRQGGAARQRREERPSQPGGLGCGRVSRAEEGGSEGGGGINGPACRTEKSGAVLLTGRMRALLAERKRQKLPG